MPPQYPIFSLERDVVLFCEFFCFLWRGLLTAIERDFLGEVFGDGERACLCLVVAAIRIVDVSDPRSTVFCFALFVGGFLDIYFAEFVHEVDVFPVPVDAECVFQLSDGAFGSCFAVFADIVVDITVPYALLAILAAACVYDEERDANESVSVFGGTEPTVAGLFYPRNEGSFSFYIFIH